MRACISVLFWMGGVFLSADAYKAGVLVSSNNAISDVMPHIYKAGGKNVDIVLLPSDISDSIDNYDETVKVLSKAAKEAGLYLVAHLIENTVCQRKQETVRSNLVFDREGSVVAVYRKPTTYNANCTTSDSPVSFKTDFGVTFDLLMEEDLMLRIPRLNNVVVVGSWRSEIPFLSASQFTSTWAYTTNANVLSQYGIFAGNTGLKAGSGSLVIADLKNGVDEETSNSPVIAPAIIKNFPVEDLSQYLFKPLHVEADSRRVEETMCHNNFCCQFNVMATLTGSDQESSYGLAAFDGIRHYGGRHFIGIQSCAVFACAGLYKKTCSIGSINNNTNVVFEKLSITANFKNGNSIQYPIIVSNEPLKSNNFNFHTESDKKSKYATVEISDSENLFAFGIIGRDFENDYEESPVNQDGGIFDDFTEDLEQLFDYLWIRLRILLFIVSIYILEMM